MRGPAKPGTGVGSGDGIASKESPRPESAGKRVPRTLYRHPHRATCTLLGSASPKNRISRQGRQDRCESRSIATVWVRFAQMSEGVREKREISILHIVHARQ